jgi:CheY-like chemotaxis protein
MSDSEARIAALQRRVADLQDDVARRDSFLTLLAHELRTPLTAIIGWADLLRAMPPTADRVKRGAEAIERSARIQIRLVEDLLSGARLETGTLHLAQQPVYLSTLVAAGVDALRPVAAERGLDIAIDATAHGGTVLGDEDRLQQVFANVLTAALKLPHHGGRVQVVLDRDDVRAEIRVFYISPEESPLAAPALRERKQLLDADLGLTVARQLTELHGGTFDAATADATDAFAFTLTLPLLPLGIDEPRKIAPADAPAACTGLRILVVDDEHEARSLVAEVLTHHGANVDVAESTFLAMHALARVKYDVLVSDIAMPYDDGFMLIEQLRRDDGPNRSLPAVALTAHSSTDTRDRAIASGFAAFVTKPVAPTALVNVVATLGRGLHGLHGLHGLDDTDWMTRIG